jgi:hypothetical protein
MALKVKQAVIMILSLFLGGSLVSCIGLSKGHDMAIRLSRPLGANSWSTSDGTILAYTYVPVIMGSALIILSLVFSTVLFIKWFNKYTM